MCREARATDPDGLAIRWKASALGREHNLGRDFVQVACSDRKSVGPSTSACNVSEAVSKRTFDMWQRSLLQCA